MVHSEERLEEKQVCLKNKTKQKQNRDTTFANRSSFTSAPVPCDNCYRLRIIVNRVEHKDLVSSTGSSSIST